MSDLVDKKNATNNHKENHTLISYVNNTFSQAQMTLHNS